MGWQLVALPLINTLCLETNMIFKNGLVAGIFQQLIEIEEYFEIWMVAGSFCSSNGFLSPKIIVSFKNLLVAGSCCCGNSSREKNPPEMSRLPVSSGLAMDPNKRILGYFDGSWQLLLWPTCFFQNRSVLQMLVGS